MVAKNKVQKKKLPPTSFNLLCKQLVAHLGGTQTQAAEKLGFAQSTLNECINDTKRTTMPPQCAMIAEIETNGRFKCESLCPELAEIMPLARKVEAVRARRLEIMRGAKS